MGYSGSADSGIMNMEAALIVIAIIAVMAVLFYFAFRKKDDEDTYAGPDDAGDSWTLSEPEKKKEAEKEPEKGEVSKKTAGSSVKSGTAVTYGRGMTKKTSKESEEKEWETDVIYSYCAGDDIWRCVYCDGENPASAGSCQVCGRMRYNYTGGMRDDM